MAQRLVIPIPRIWGDSQDHQDGPMGKLAYHEK